MPLILPVSEMERFGSGSDISANIKLPASALGNKGEEKKTSFIDKHNLIASKSSKHHT